MDDRGHRENLFNTKIKYFGVGVAEHKEYDVCTVIDYVGDIVSYVDKSKNKMLPKSNRAKPAVSNIFLYGGSSGNNKENMGIKAINSMLMTAKKKEMAKLGKDMRKVRLDEDNSGEPFKNEPDAPEGCVSCRTKIMKKRIGKKNYDYYCEDIYTRGWI